MGYNNNNCGMRWRTWIETFGLSEERPIDPITHDNSYDPYEEWKIRYSKAIKHKRKEPQYDKKSKTTVHNDLKSQVATQELKSDLLSEYDLFEKIPSSWLYASFITTRNIFLIAIKNRIYLPDVVDVCVDALNKTILRNYSHKSELNHTIIILSMLAENLDCDILDFFMLPDDSIEEICKDFLQEHIPLAEGLSKDNKQYLTLTITEFNNLNINQFPNKYLDILIEKNSDSQAISYSLICRFVKMFSNQSQRSFISHSESIELLESDSNSFLAKLYEAYIL